jgi:hypothetical protein
MGRSKSLEGIGMTERARIKQKIQLKNQALRLIRTERDNLKHKLNLLNLRDFLQGRIGKTFDPELSRQLDAVQFLIED